jgi:hypothetical protein
MVLMDIRTDHRGCVAFRDEIKKENPNQVVAFLVGGPNYIDMEPSPESYTSEAHGLKWGESMRHAVRESCDLLPQRNSFVEASWRIAAGRRINGAPLNAPDEPAATEVEVPPISPLDFVFTPEDA